MRCEKLAPVLCAKGCGKASRAIADDYNGSNTVCRSGGCRSRGELRASISVDRWTRYGTLYLFSSQTVGTGRVVAWVTGRSIRHSRAVLRGVYYEGFAGVGFFVLIVFASGAQAGFGLYNLATKVGLDVVQANDTRHFFVLQADIATVFTPNLRLEIGAEAGRGDDLDGTEIRARGGGAFLKYLWPHKSGTAFAYMGGGLGGEPRAPREIDHQQISK